MLAWLSSNLVNIVIIAVLVLVVGFLIRGLVRDKKAGKNSCSGSCGSCGGCSSAFSKSEEDQGATYRVHVTVEGMMCGMCEAHINDAIRKATTVQKVSSSHQKGETLVTTKGLPDLTAIKRAIKDTGYKVTGMQVEKLA